MTDMSDLRILLVDDHNLFLEGLTNLLTSEGIKVLGSAHDGFDALRKARQLSPNVILMDIHMPLCDGVNATRLIKAEMPEIKTVMLTMSEEEEDLFQAVQSGASGYLLKSLDAENFLNYLKDLQSGHPPFSPGLAEKILNAFAAQSTMPVQKPESGNLAIGIDENDDCNRLSPRQMQVLTLVTQGLTYHEVAETLNISERTVKYHMGEILNCLHLQNRAQVIAYAAQTGLSRPAQ